jgi:signal recognition particle receptor subunit beta
MLVVKIAKLRLHRYAKPEVDALLFVVDSSKSETEVAEALTECKQFVEAHAKRWWPVLILANKQEVPGAMGVLEVKIHVMSSQKPTAQVLLFVAEG